MDFGSGNFCNASVICAMVARKSESVSMLAASVLAVSANWKSIELVQCVHFNWLDYDLPHP